jgi:hypothetical protein
MITPNSLQVKNYFGNKVIQSLSSNRTFIIKNQANIFFRLGCYWYTTENYTEELIWDDHDGYAKTVEGSTCTMCTEGSLGKHSVTIGKSTHLVCDDCKSFLGQ